MWTQNAATDALSWRHAGAETCPDGWYVYSGNCYWISSHQKSQPSASAKCAQTPSSQLTSINDANELSFIDSIMYGVLAPLSLACQGFAVLGDSMQCLYVGADPVGARGFGPPQNLVAAVFCGLDP